MELSLRPRDEVKLAELVEPTINDETFGEVFNLLSYGGWAHIVRFAVPLYWGEEFSSSSLVVAIQTSPDGENDWADIPNELMSEFEQTDSTGHIDVRHYNLDGGNKFLRYRAVHTGTVPYVLSVQVHATPYNCRNVIYEGFYNTRILDATEYEIQVGDVVWGNTFDMTSYGGWGTLYICWKQTYLPDDTACALNLKVYQADEDLNNPGNPAEWEIISEMSTESATEDGWHSLNIYAGAQKKFITMSFEGDVDLARFAFGAQMKRFTTNT